MGILITIVGMIALLGGIGWGIAKMFKKQFKKGFKVIGIGFLVFIVSAIIGGSLIPDSPEQVKAKHEAQVKEEAQKQADAAQKAKENAQKDAQKAKEEEEKKANELELQAGVAMAMLIEKEYYLGVAKAEYTNHKIYVTYNNKALIQSLYEQAQLGNSVANELLGNAQSIAKKASREAGGTFPVFLTMNGYNAWSGNATGWEYTNGKLNQ